MSPELRLETVQRRLREIQLLLDVLRRHQDVTSDDLSTDLEQRLIIERALQQVVDLAVKVNAHVIVAEGGTPPADYFSTFAGAADIGLIDTKLAAQLAPSTGLRNRLVHQYDDIDLGVVVGSLPEAIVGYATYINQVAGFLKNRN